MSSIDERVDTGGRGLRAHAARGTLINSAFQVGLAGLGLLRRVLVAAFLTREEFGVWGIIITTLLTLAWLKELGISDKYVQQSEPDQELAYQKAFTLEFLLSMGFFVLLLGALPIYALAYGHAEIILPGIVLATAVPISAFESALWIPYRRMQFVRHRTLGAVDPVVGFVLTVLFGVLGTGYWCLVIGAVGGSIAGSIVAVAYAPYKPALRFSKQTVREYASFSWPLFGLQVTNLVSVQAVMLSGGRAVGVAGLGVITLAASVSQFAERVDQIVSQTIYPAVCAVVDRVDLMFEAFVTSNRLAVMWGLPFGAGLALFAGDLVQHVLGERWEPAIELLATLGLVAGFLQIGFNWEIFMRAVDNTRPLFAAAITNLVATAALVLPLMFAFGLTGYAIGAAAVAVVQIAQRIFYLRRLFPDYRATAHLLRSIAPTVPPVLLVLALRQVLDGSRTLPRAAAEVGLYVVATGVATFLFERDLIREMLGYLRGGGGIRTRAGVEAK